MLTIPCIRVFRRGVMGEYRGPENDPQAIASYLIEDAQVF
jgi:hypothetical protein